MMEDIKDVKDYLDEVIKQLPLSVIKYHRLETASMSDTDCREIEASLNIELPEAYRSALITYDWSDLNIGNINFNYGSTEIINRNSGHYHLLQELFDKKRFLEIGQYEADSILIALDNTSNEAGRIHYVNHVKYPEIIIEPVSSNFTNFVISAVIDLRFKKDANFYVIENTLSHDETETFFSEILMEIIKVDSIAAISPFWPNFIRGY